ncbi:hypothetical protein AGMMS49928_07050 [Spirochaetia bacterium]|nr:hypothetical protein AGMMS49928_07050 [Spirochaetia bacterium]
MKKKSSLVILIPLIVVVLAVGCIVFYRYYTRPRPVWMVDPGLVEKWKQILAESPSPLVDAKGEQAKILPLQSGTKISPYYYGWQISTRYFPGEKAEGDVSVNVYRNLSSERRSGNAMALALDPWMIFRKYMTSPLSWEDLTKPLPPSKGQILFAGQGSAAAWAWTSQLLQESPGVFSGDPELWEKTSEQVLGGRLSDQDSSLFQSGARTYSWNELWPILLDDKDAWVYAPLSLIRSIPNHESNILEADIFPSRPAWPEFGLQADILWASPLGNLENQAELEESSRWLYDVRTQTLIANTLGFLSAHPESPPYNPVSSDIRIAWLRSAYVWEDPKP